MKPLMWLVLLCGSLGYSQTGPTIDLRDRCIVYHDDKPVSVACDELFGTKEQFQAAKRDVLREELIEMTRQRDDAIQQVEKYKALWERQPLYRAFVDKDGCSSGLSFYQDAVTIGKGWVIEGVMIDTEHHTISGQRFVK